MKTILLNLALFAGIAGYAQGGVGGGPIASGLVGTGYGVCGPIAHMMFDCPVGPGYLRITSANVYGERHTKNVYIGSREACLAQATILRAKRSQIATMKMIATCSATQNTLQRWTYNQYGASVAMPQLQYPKMEECLADAKAANELP